MRQAISAERAAELVPDGASVMIGGFMGVGSPHRLIDALVARGARDLTLICNDTAMPGVGVGKLITAGAVRKVIASHIGLNPETQKKMIAGELDVELVPQGTLVERIRAAGDDPAEYVEISFKVPERNYVAWPEAIRQGFEPARTVRTGTLKVEILPQGGAQ